MEKKISKSKKLVYYADKWENFLRSIAGHALNPYHDLTGVSFSFGDMVQVVEEGRFRVTPSSRALPKDPKNKFRRFQFLNLRNKLIYGITAVFEPEDESQYLALKNLYKYDFNENDIRFLQFLNTLISYCPEDPNMTFFLNTNLARSYGSEVIKWLQSIQKEEAEDPQFAKLPFSWKLKMFNDAFPYGEDVDETNDLIVKWG